ncbi:MAG: DUF962 domain-containing protein [Steroidobacteraceae bacterium]|nr:DUF962 domain-containing protein [Steroidobacteraceae bacterium]MDW8259394.1 hypothetical protein [Gammaproteobacteria bacterium]
MRKFLDELHRQRADDHRYYHRSRINQLLHLISAISFLYAYVLLLHDPAAAALIGWGVAMVTRQTGHFFFEPKGYDPVNRVTHQFKEAVKVGYNLRRKVILHAVWIAAPLLLLIDPTLGGSQPAPQDLEGWLRAVGLLWLAVGVGALLVRAAQLAATRGICTACAWLAKIVTDPFHDIRLYYRSPLYVLRGEWLDCAVR